MNNKGLENLVFNYDKLKVRLEKVPQDKKKAQFYLKEMASSGELSSVGKFKTFLDKTLMRLYDDVDFMVPSHIDLKKLLQESHVILVPNHQSHADYLVLNYVLYKHYNWMSYIAGGINLNVFPIGSIFRRCGCFFIRRSFSSNILYKLVLEGYIAALMQQHQWPIQFFFEGGRSRTGKIMPPKFGLFQMIIESHKHLSHAQGKDAKDLVFVPISIVHEAVPEQKSLVAELGGQRKKKESFIQVLKLYKFMKKKFGTVHIKVGDPIKYRSVYSSVRENSQTIGFDIFRSIGKGMMVTPSSILALVLLDLETGAMTWDAIIQKGQSILNYCYTYSVPVSGSLDKNSWENSLKRALQLFVDNGKIQIIEKKRLGKHFYVIPEESRMEMLYFKNMILHHFLVPFFISSAWINFINRTIRTPDELGQFLLKQRKQLKFEFILPTVKELFFRGFEIVSKSINRPIHSMEDCFKLTPEEYYKVAETVSPFASTFRYIYEGQYIAAQTLKSLSDQDFSRDRFFKTSKEIFEIEKTHGRIIKYPESYTMPLMQNTLDYFLHQRILYKDKGKFHVEDSKTIEETIVKLTKDLTDILNYTFRPQGEQGLSTELNKNVNK